MIPMGKSEGWDRLIVGHPMILLPPRVTPWRVAPMNEGPCLLPASITQATGRPYPTHGTGGLDYAAEAVHAGFG